MSIDAMKQALEALEQYTNVVTSVNDPNSWVTVSDGGKPARDAITALRTAIEQAQEPVAWMHNLIEGNVITHRPADIDRHPERWAALYTAPPPCPTCEALARSVMMDQTSHDMAPRQWQGLTDEEFSFGIQMASNTSWMKAAKWVEAKLREKNT